MTNEEKNVIQVKIDIAERIMQIYENCTIKKETSKELANLAVEHCYEYGRGERVVLDKAKELGMINAEDLEKRIAELEARYPLQQDQINYAHEKIADLQKEIVKLKGAVNRLYDNQHTPNVLTNPLCDDNPCKCSTCNDTGFIPKGCSWNESCPDCHKKVMEEMMKAVRGEVEFLKNERLKTMAQLAEEQFKERFEAVADTYCFEDSLNIIDDFRKRLFNNQ